ncbi:MAG: L7Ae/L30e/S12e/Gadd45 family ribosomal protein [Acutalibacteraceae bacterium]
MNDKILSLLGLCRRAGRLTMGSDAVKDSIAKGEAKLVILAGDASKRTEKDVMYITGQYKTDLIKLNRTKDEIGAAVGKYTAVIAINDSGFAGRLKELSAQQ